MQPSAPFRDREFNGTTLLEEWAELRAARETQLSVASAVMALRPLQKLAPAEARVRLSQWAAGAQASTPALAALVTRWIPRVRVAPDLEALLGHFERLALLGDALDGARRT